MEDYMYQVNEHVFRRNVNLDLIDEAISFHLVMENGENQYIFIRHSELVFPTARHSMVQ